MTKKKGFITVKAVRFTTATVLILVILWGTVASFSCGNTCSLDLFGISFTCPLGFLQTTLASRTFVPEAWLSMGLVILATILLGRFFCSWLCPAPLVKAFFAVNAKPKSKAARPKSGEPVSNPVEAIGAKETSKASRLLNIMETPYSNYVVLAGSLASSFFFGFPVFCFICPVGLFFGSLFAIRRLFFSQMVTLELILLPAILLVELVAFKKWCVRLCPLGALLRIVGSVNNRIFRPRVNGEACFKTREINCQVCKKICTEGINLEEEKPSMRNCTNCLECWEKCPTKAIQWLPSIRRRVASNVEE